METKQMTQEIIGLEKKYWTAMKDHDLKTALELTDFPCLVAGAHGLMSVDQEQFKEMFEAGKETVRSFEFEADKTQVRLVNPQTAVIAYQLKTSLTQKGETKDMHAIDTSTWVKRGDKWVCAMHTEIEMQEQ